MKSILPFVVVAATIGIFFAVEIRSPAPDPSALLAGSLPTVKQKAIDIVVDLTKLLMTWSVAVIGAMAYFLKSALEGKILLRRRGLLTAELVILCSVFSLFFGHLVFNAILNMLALDIFSVQDTALVTWGIAQYCAFLASLALFGLYVHFTYWPESQEPHHHRQRARRE